MHGETALPMEFGPAGPLRGTPGLPGDKSISHRALMIAAMARGRSRINGLCEGSDLHSTASALRAMGVRIERDGDSWTVDGVGSGCLLQPERALDMGNSGTSTRLLMGLTASHPITATFTGDSSLCRRPMDRVTGPLGRIGADFASAPGGRLPVTVRGLCPAVPAVHRLDIASAQVKSALLLAALNIPGITRVIEPVPTRDHSERMLAQFGADIEVRATEEGGREIALRGEAELKPREIGIPGDISAAAFLIVAALIVPGSEIAIRGVGVNPMRRALVDLIGEMGGRIALRDRGDRDGEPVADLEVRHSKLKGIDVPPALIPAMIDEFPIFFVAAAFAEGVSRTSGLGELRVKESDRIAAMAEGLRAIGANVEESEDGLAIEGSGGAPLAGGARIESRLDHRIAMSFAVAGLHSKTPIEIDDMRPVATSFPGFAETQRGLSR
ncbi:MAG TPA: 3-phosphoshikimate 1-carboxyvinyltransferase [Allosphingosinicella sp.]